MSLPPTIFVHLTKNRAVTGTRMGMGFAIVSIGLLVGSYEHLDLMISSIKR